MAPFLSLHVIPLVESIEGYNAYEGLLLVLGISQKVRLIVKE